MAEFTTPLIELRTDRKCDKCDKGLMRPVKQPSLAPRGSVGIRHKCSSCGALGVFDRSYPYHQSVNFFEFIAMSGHAIKDMAGG